MVYTFDYDSSYPFGPALPVIELSIQPVGGTTTNVVLTAIVDSGADATIFPIHGLERADVEQVGRARMRWGSHSSQVYDVYLAAVRVGRDLIHGVRILANKENSEAVLGRDVLNQLVVTLNGPANVVEIAT